MNILLIVGVLFVVVQCVKILICKKKKVTLTFLCIVLCFKQCRVM